MELYAVLVNRIVVVTGLKLSLQDYDHFLIKKYYVKVVSMFKGV
jgi:hypothetical protein